MSSPSSSSSRWTSLLAWLLLACVLIFATWLRVHDFGESLWLDELHTAWCVAGSFGEVAPRAVIGNQPPLPYWLLWGWVQIAGLSEWSLRGPALVASLGAIAAVFVALRRWTGSYAAALVAALALTVEPNSIFYGGEARVYAWVQLLAVLHVMLFVEILTSTPSPKVRVGMHAAWIVVGALLFYVHYTAAILFVAEGMIWLLVGCAQHTRLKSLVCCAHPTKNVLIHLLIDTAALSLLCLPALGHLWQIAGRRDNWALFIGRPNLGHLLGAVPLAQALIGIFVLLVIVGLGRWATKRSPRLLSPLSLTSLTVLLWLSVPLCLTWLLSFFEVARLFHVRYYVVVIPGMACVLGWLVTLLPSVKLQWGALPIIGALLLTRTTIVADYVTDPEHRPRRNEGWREAVAWINNDSASDEILLMPGLIEGDALRSSEDPQLREYCSFPLRSAYAIERPVTIEPFPMTEPWRLSDDQLRAYDDQLRAQKHRHVVLVIRGSSKYRQEVCEKLLQAMIHPRYHIFHRASFGDVGVYSLTIWPWSAAHILDSDTKAKLRRIFPADPEYQPNLLDLGSPDSAPSDTP